MFLCAFGSLVCSFLLWGHEIPWDADLGICSSNLGYERHNLYEISLVFYLNVWIEWGIFIWPNQNFIGWNPALSSPNRWWFADHNQLATQISNDLITWITTYHMNHMNDQRVSGCCIILLVVLPAWRRCHIKNPGFRWFHHGACQGASGFQSSLWVGGPIFYMTIRNENKQREDSFVDLDKLRKKLAMMGLGRMTSFWIRGISFTTLSNSWSTRRRCCGKVGGVGDVGESGIQGFSRCWETSIPFGELVSVIL